MRRSSFKFSKSNGNNEKKRCTIIDFDIIRKKTLELRKVSMIVLYTLRICIIYPSVIYYLPTFFTSISYTTYDKRKVGIGTESILKFLIYTLINSERMKKNICANKMSVLFNICKNAKMYNTKLSNGIWINLKKNIPFWKIIKWDFYIKIEKL